MTPRAAFIPLLILLAGCESSTGSYSGGPPMAPMGTMGVGPMTSADQMRAQMDDLRARAAAGDPSVKVTSSSSTTSLDPAQARAMQEQVLAQRAAEMPSEERSRRQAYVNSHPALSPSARGEILTGLYPQGLTVDEVAALTGPLQPVAATPGVGPGVVVYSFTSAVPARTTYFYFQEGKLVRWTSTQQR